MLFVAAAVSELEYDETAALRQVKLAEAAYCVSDVGNWTCAVCVDKLRREPAEERVARASVKAREELRRAVVQHARLHCPRVA